MAPPLSLLFQVPRVFNPGLLFTVQELGLQGPYRCWGSVAPEFGEPCVVGTEHLLGLEPRLPAWGLPACRQCLLLSSQCLGSPPLVASSLCMAGTWVECSRTHMACSMAVAAGLDGGTVQCGRGAGRKQGLWHL